MTGPRPRARVKHCGREKAEQACWAVPLTPGTMTQVLFPRHLGQSGSWTGLSYTKYHFTSGPGLLFTVQERTKC